MNKNIQGIIDNPISSFLGVLFIVFGFLVYFVETKVDIPYYAPIIMWVLGVLLLFSRDKLLDILTLGLSGLVKNINTKVKRKDIDGRHYNG